MDDRVAWGQEYLVWKARNSGAGERSFKLVRNGLKSFQEWMGSRSWADIDDAALDAYAASLKGSFNTQRSTFAHAKNILIWAWKTGRTPELVGRHRGTPLQPPRKQRRVLSEDERKLLLKCAEETGGYGFHRDKAIVMLIMETGMRTGHVAYLRTVDYQPKLKRVLYRMKIYDLSDACLEAINAWMVEKSLREPSVLLFSGLSSHKIRDIINKNLAKAGINAKAGDIVFQKFVK